jgi:hypothetical protein
MRLAGDRICLLRRSIGKGCQHTAENFGSGRELGSKFSEFYSSNQPLFLPDGERLSAPRFIQRLLMSKGLQD